jgi:parallel beta-helix repeat protein
VVGGNVTGNHFYLCQGAGVRLTSARDVSVTGNVMNECQDGVLVDEDGATTAQPPSGWAITGNEIAASTRNGVRVINATDSDSYTPRFGVISGNVIRSSTQSGITLLGSDEVLVSGNLLSDCTTNNTYPGIDVQTSLPAATHRGGLANAIIGNSVTDRATFGWSVPVRIQQSGGGAITNVSNTFLAFNRLAAQNTLFYSYGVSTESPIIAGNLVGTSYGPTNGPWRDFTATSAVPASLANGTVTNFGAAAGVTLTLPSLTGATAMQGVRLTFIRIALFNLVITPTAGDTIMRNNIATGDLTLTDTTDQVVTLISHREVWYAHTADHP